MRRVQLLVLAGVLGLFAVEGRAGTMTDQLKESVGKVARILDDHGLRSVPKVKERQAAIRGVVNGIFDFGESARRSLGRHWQERTPAEREEFVKLFAELIERAYLSKIDLLAGEKVTYAGESVNGDQATVRTQVITDDGGYSQIDYRMLSRGDRWLVYDVSFDGWSLVGSYRSQFNKIIQGSSYQELVRKLKGKQEETRSERDAGALREKKSASILAAAAIMAKVRGSYKN